MPPVLSVIMPFHHEEKFIAQTLHELEEQLTSPTEILLIYDDEKDPTLGVIKNIQVRNAVIKTCFNNYKPGIAGAMLTGLEKSSGKFILFLVADDPGPLVLVKPMLGLMEQGYDLVSGTRYSQNGGVAGGSSLGRVASVIGNRLFYYLSGSKLSDATCGIKMFRRNMLEKIKLNPSFGWGMAFELAILAQHDDFKITEVPYFSYNRLEGGSSLFKVFPRLFIYGWIFGWGILKLRIKK